MRHGPRARVLRGCRAVCHRGEYFLGGTGLGAPPWVAACRQQGQAGMSAWWAKPTQRGRDHRAGRQLAAPQPADGERAAIQATRGTLRGGVADSAQRIQPPPRHPRCAGSTRESAAPGDAVRQHTPSRNPAEPGPDHASRMPSHARHRRYRTRACAPRRSAAVCAEPKSRADDTLCTSAALGAIPNCRLRAANSCAGSARRRMQISGVHGRRVTAAPVNLTALVPPQSGSTGQV